MHREKLIEFTKANDGSYSELDFSKYAIEQLVILKVAIEFNIEHKGRYFIFTKLPE